MSKILYLEKQFKNASLLLIDQANDIIEEYQAEGLDLTLRQLYYQFVSRDLIANTQREYKRIGGIINNARLAGLIDWNAIEDRTRNIKRNSHWSDPGEIIRTAAESFQLDHWEGQHYKVEVWIEKEALIGVIDSICSDLDVSYFACKGYVSQSEMWAASQRFKRYNRCDQQPIIIHLGDHDPSGIDMTRDIEERQQVFEIYDIEVNRIALNMDQIEEYNPPPNPAKLTDTRSNAYVNQYGSESWELDALEPRVLRKLIEDTVLQYRDQDMYDEVLETEKEYLTTLKRIEKNWDTL